MQLVATDPTTGEVIARVAPIDDREAARRVDAAHRAHDAWRHASFSTRATPMRRVAELLEREAGPLARLMAREMGKPLAEGRAEVEKCAWVCRHYAEHAEAMLADEAIASDARESFVSFRPLGVVFAIMPWNFPLWQVFRFAAPTLMAGNGAVLKHAETVPGCAAAIGELMDTAGFPEGLFGVLPIDKSSAGAIIEHPAVRAITLTGSTTAGRAVAALAGQALKPTLLELGGSDPLLVLDGADIVRAAEVAVRSRLINNGQSCIAAKRFIVVEPHRKAFEEAVVERMAAARMGDPSADGVDLGPLARLDLRQSLHRQVRASVASGARCLLGGTVPDGPGAFYPPTVLTDVRQGMPAYHEELFGPVAAILPAASDDDAVRIANDTDFGLGAAVFAADAARGRAVARDRIEAGCCFVEDFVRSDPRLPFGGIRDSGWGRELGAMGIRAFVNAKTVWVGER